jgi:hypothetical protein
LLSNLAADSPGAGAPSKDRVPIVKTCEERQSLRDLGAAEDRSSTL